MRRVVGSGSLDHAKEDGVQAPFLLQLKHTSNASFRLVDSEFNKTEHHANRGGHYPAWLVKTDGREYLVLDASWLDYICEKWRKTNDRTSRKLK